MADYWQVIRTDEYGRISGETYSDPLTAVKCISVDYKTKHYIELYLKPLGSTVCKFPSDKTNYAIISKSTMCDGDIIVEFDHRELKDMEELIEARKIQKGYTGRYYTDTIIFDFRTGKIVKELHQGA